MLGVAKTNKITPKQGVQQRINTAEKPSALHKDDLDFNPWHPIEFSLSPQGVMVTCRARIKPLVLLNVVPPRKTKDGISRSLQNYRVYVLGGGEVVTAFCLHMDVTLPTMPWGLSPLHDTHSHPPLVLFPGAGGVLPAEFPKGLFQVPGHLLTVSLQGTREEKHQQATR